MALRPEALYGNELVDEHYVRACSVERNPEQWDIGGYDDWGRAARRIRILDHNGEKSYVLLRQMKLRRIL